MEGVPTKILGRATLKAVILNFTIVYLSSVWRNMTQFEYACIASCFSRVGRLISFSCTAARVLNILPHVWNQNAAISAFWMKQYVLLHIRNADTKTFWVTLSSNILKTFYSSESSTKCHLHKRNTHLGRY